MTKDKDFKDLVRARATETCEPYTAAREQLLEEVGAEAEPGRIVGLENRYAVSADFYTSHQMSAAEVTRRVFRHAVSWGSATNVYLESGARLYVSGEGVMEYATPECAGPKEATCYVRAGEMILLDLAASGQRLMADEGIGGVVRVAVDRSEAGGCHENYVADRMLPTDGFARLLVPFLVTRAIYSGGGGMVYTGDGPRFAVSPRAYQLSVGAPRGPSAAGWRHFLNVNADPHADAERFRRVHVDIGDVSQSDTASVLKVGATSLVVALLEQQSGALGEDLTLADPIAALLDVSLDTDGTAQVRLANGQRKTAIDIQRVVLDLARRHVQRVGGTAEERRVIAQWQRTLDGVASGPRSITNATEWAGRLQRLEDSVGGIDDPRALAVDSGFDVIAPTPWLPAHRVCSEEEITAAKTTSPQLTRARLRSRFITACKQARCNYTVDWTHIKVNDATQRTIILRDPFAWDDPRVERMLASVGVTE